MAPTGTSTHLANTEQKSRLLRFTGHRNFRQRLVLSILSQRPVRIDSIRPEAASPGIRDFEANFLRLLEKLTNGTHVEISYTGTSVLLKPGVVSGGTVVHECSLARGVGYWLEWVLVLAPFAKTEMRLTLRGVTSGAGDLGVDALRTVTLPHLALFMPLDTVSTLASSLELRIAKRGAAPLGGGEVHFRCPLVRHLSALNFTAPGRVRKIRGIATATRVSPQIANRLVDAARAVLGRYVPDLYLFADVYRGEDAGKSPGFTITLLATSTTGAICSAETVSPQHDPGPPEDLATDAARMLLEQIAKRGCIDPAHQPLVLLLMALGPQDVAKCTMSALTPNAVQIMRDISDALGVRFRIAHNAPPPADDLTPPQHPRDALLHSLRNPEQLTVSCVGINFGGFKKVG